MSDGGFWTEVVRAAATSCVPSRKLYPQFGVTTTFHVDSTSEARNVGYSHYRLGMRGKDDAIVTQLLTRVR